MRRRDFIRAFAAIAARWPLAADAQTRPAPLRASPTRPAALTQAQLDALGAYDKALNQLKSILSERRAQISSHQSLPNLPGQALYLARVNMMSAYKDLTDALPSKIGRDNRFGIPPAYFDADTEPLLDEYRKLFDIMEAPPANAQNSDTPLKDVVDLGIAIARAKGLAAANAEVAGRISLGLFFAETDGKQSIRNSPANTDKASLQTGPSERRTAQRKGAETRKSTQSPGLIARDEREEARLGNLDPPYNHCIAVRDGLANAHADLF